MQWPTSESFLMVGEKAELCSRELEPCAELWRGNPRTALAILGRRRVPLRYANCILLARLVRGLAHAGTYEASPQQHLLGCCFR